MFKKEKLTKEFGDYKVEIEELDAIESADFNVYYHDLLKNHNDMVKAYDENGEALDRKKASELLAANTKIMKEAFSIPNIIVNGEELKDIPMFLKYIGLNSAFSLYLDVMKIGILSEEEEGK